RADRLYSGYLGNIVPTIRGDDQRRNADFGSECADPIARIVYRVSPRKRPQARPDGLGATSHRQYPRWLRSNRAPPGARLRIRHRGDIGECRGNLFSDVANADRVSAGGGPGRLLYLGAIAGWRFGHPHPRRGEADRGGAEADASDPEHFRDRWVFDH